MNLYTFSCLKRCKSCIFDFCTINFRDINIEVLKTDNLTASFSSSFIFGLGTPLICEKSVFPLSRSDRFVSASVLDFPSTAAMWGSGQRLRQVRYALSTLFEAHRKGYAEFDIDSIIFLLEPLPLTAVTGFRNELPHGD